MGDLHDSYPLTEPLSFTIAKDVEALEPAPVAAPDSGLSPAEQAAGRHWSAKVVLVAGLDPARAFAADAKSFQVLSCEFPTSGFSSDLLGSPAHSC